uniref:Uncharacterized protein n=1 Tax=Romanomermis culicivorax TaxID=13658 RepID=A0A915K7A8_ROMCU
MQGCAVGVGALLPPGATHVTTPTDLHQKICEKLLSMCDYHFLLKSQSNNKRKNVGRIPKTYSNKKSDELRQNVFKFTEIEKSNLLYLRILKNTDSLLIDKKTKISYWNFCVVFVIWILIKQLTNSFLSDESQARNIADCSESEIFSVSFHMLALSRSSANRLRKRHIFPTKRMVVPMSTI